MANLMMNYEPLRMGAMMSFTVPHDKALIRAHHSQYIPPCFERTDRTLFIGRLPLDTTEQDIYHLFQEYHVETVRLIHCRVTGDFRGYGFVVFWRLGDCQRAYRKRAFYLKNRKILVDWERAHHMKGFVPRRLGGGLGGRKESGQMRFGGRETSFKSIFRD